MEVMAGMTTAGVQKPLAVADDGKLLLGADLHVTAGGLTQAEHDALLAQAAALGAPTDAAPASLAAAGTVPAWLRWLARGIGSPADAAAASGTGLIGLLQALIARLPAALASGRLPVESVSQAQTQYEISIAGLAPGATALSPVIDLGASRPSLQIQAEKLNGANQADTLQVVQSSDPVAMTAPAPVMRGDAIGNSAAFSNTSGQQCCVYGRPSRRSIQVQFTCASGGVAQPAGAVMTLTLNWGR